MKKLAIVFLFIFTASFFNTVTAQQKYAVIFGSEHKPDTADVLSKYVLYSEKDTSDIRQQEAVWNDSYLMWELLLEKGFSNDNIFFLYHKGKDFVRDHLGLLNDRYDPRVEHADIIDSEDGVLSDGQSTEQDLFDVLDSLKTGTGSYPKITKDDFLVLFFYGHGDYERIRCNDYHDTLPSTYITLNELKSQLNLFPCKKIILMQNSKSGSFIDTL